MQKIANICLSMKKDLKNALTSIHQSALSGIIILNSTYDYEGNQWSCYLKDYYF